MGEDENPITAEDISIDVAKDKEDDARGMLKKHEQARSG